MALFYIYIFIYKLEERNNKRIIKPSELIYFVQNKFVFKISRTHIHTKYECEFNNVSSTIYFYFKLY